MEYGLRRGTETSLRSSGSAQVSFEYRIRGDSLFLEPVMPTCSDDECFEAQWAVAVAYPGLPWKHVDP